MPGLTAEPHSSSMGKGTKWGWGPWKGGLNWCSQTLWLPGLEGTPETQQHWRGKTHSLHFGSSGHFPGVCLIGVYTKPGSTRSTIAINRIYFVQPLLTYM